MDQNLEKLVKLLEKDREIFQMLRQCPYEILRRFEVKDYEADQFVLNQGEIHNRFYIIASGYVDIYVESAHGKRYLLCTYMKGDYIGELEIFKQTGYISRIQSRGKVRSLELDRTFFLQWIRTDKNFNEYMIRTLCDNSYRMCLNMGENTLYTLKQRICQYLLRNMEMDAKFVKEATAAGLVNLKGHRTVGGMRASIYNAMPKAGVEALVAFMKKFEEENK